MTRFEIIKNRREISYNDRAEIREGCTLEQADQEPERLESFDNLEAAREALKRYKSKVEKLSGAGTFFSVTEYYIQDAEYDDCGDWIGGGDVWDFAGMPDAIE